MKRVIRAVKISLSALLLGAVALTAGPVELNSQSSATVRAIQIDRDDIGGVVVSDKGPEAGVWVIAETTNLPTKFAKIVVIDDPKAGWKA